MAREKVSQNRERGLFISTILPSEPDFANEKGLYETMIKDSEDEYLVEFYETAEAAAEGHEKWLSIVRKTFDIEYKNSYGELFKVSLKPLSNKILLEEFEHFLRRYDAKIVEREKRNNSEEFLGVDYSISGNGIDLSIQEIKQALEKVKNRK